MTDEEDEFGWPLVQVHRSQGVDGKGVGGNGSSKAEAWEAEKNMLSGLPIESRRDCDASEAILSHENLSFLTGAYSKRVQSQG